MASRQHFHAVQKSSAYQCFNRRVTILELLWQACSHILSLKARFMPLIVPHGKPDLVRISALDWRRNWIQLLRKLHFGLSVLQLIQHNRENSTTLSETALEA